MLREMKHSWLCLQNSSATLNISHLFVSSGIKQGSKQGDNKAVYIPKPLLGPSSCSSLCSFLKCFPAAAINISDSSSGKREVAPVPPPPPQRGGQRREECKYCAVVVSIKRVEKGGGGGCQKHATKKCENVRNCFCGILALFLWELSHILCHPVHTEYLRRGVTSFPPSIVPPVAPLPSDSCPGMIFTRRIITMTTSTIDASEQNGDSLPWVSCHLSSSSFV